MALDGRWDLDRDHRVDNHPDERHSSDRQLTRTAFIRKEIVRVRWPPPRLKVSALAALSVTCSTVSAGAMFPSAGHSRRQTFVPSHSPYLEVQHALVASLSSNA